MNCYDANGYFLKLDTLMVSIVHSLSAKKGLHEEMKQTNRVIQDQGSPDRQLTSTGIYWKTRDDELPVSENECDQDQDFRRTSKCSRPTSALLEVPIKNLAAVTGAVALSRGLSVRNHTAIQASIITGANGDDNDYSLSLLHGEITEYFNRKLLNTLWTV